MSSISQAGQAVRVFTTAVEQAKSDGKVKTSGLSKLLKSVNNSTEKLSSQDMRVISNSRAKLQNVLIGQGSNLLKKKTASIDNAFTQTIKNNLNNIKRNVNDLDSKSKNANSAFHPSSRDVAKVHDQLSAFVNSIKSDIKGKGANLPDNIIADINTMHESLANVRNGIKDLNVKEGLGERKRMNEIDGRKTRTERSKVDQDYYAHK